MYISRRAIALTLLIFLIKFALTFLFTIELNIYKKRKYNFVIAWSFVYLYEMFLMLALSFGNHLNANNLCIASSGSALLITAILLLKIRKHGFVWAKIQFDTNDIIPLTAVVAFGAYCVCRSFLYFDTVWDALAYGMPRIFVFSTNDTLLVNMDTLVKNIFVNEWNGELNAVFYRVLTRNNISIPFANIEIYLYAAVNFFLLGKEWFKEKKYGSVWIYTIMFLPVVVFLSFTCKGDLLGMVTFPMFFFLLLLYWKELRYGEENVILLGGTIALGALASGARITIVPAVGILMLILLADFIKQQEIKKCIWSLAISAVCYLVGWSRYLLNLVYYGNLFERIDVPNEKVLPSLERFAATTKAYLKDILFGYNVFTHKGILWALNANAGLLGIIFLLGILLFIVWIAWFIVKKKNLKKYWRELSAIAAVVCVLLFTLSSIEYYAWSFRYFAPFFICILMGMILLLNYIQNKRIVTIMWAILLVVTTINTFSTISLAHMQGEVTGDSWYNMMQKDEISRRYAYHPYFLSSAENGINIFYDKIRSNRKILLCNSANQGISWVWGDNASNKVVLCTPEQLQEYFQREPWDAVVVTTVISIDTPFMESNSYEHYNTGLNLDIYINKNY